MKYRDSDTRVDSGKTPKDGTGSAPARTANIASVSRCAMTLRAVTVEPPAGTRTPRGISIEERKEKVAAAIARLLSSAYFQHANPEEIIRKDAELGEEGAYVREVDGELSATATSILRGMSGHKIQMIDRNFSEVDDFVSRMAAALAESIKLRRTAREIREAKSSHTRGTEVYAIDPFVAILKAFQLVAEMSTDPQKFAGNLDLVAKTTETKAVQDGTTDATRFCMSKDLEVMLQ